MGLAVRLRSNTSMEHLGPAERTLEPIPIPCNHFPSNTWIHLIWNLERVGNQVHYISLTVADQTYNVDVYYGAQPNWTQEEIDIAFQMDGNYKQEPYTVWLDQVNLLTNRRSLSKVPGITSTAITAT